MNILLIGIVWIGAAVVTLAVKVCFRNHVIFSFRYQDEDTTM